MSTDNLLITNARLVNEGRIKEADLRIRRGRIDAIADGLTATGNEVVMDAAGAYLLPGFIDDQVHFREPGLTQKGDLATESAAAVAGGITSFMEMPNVNPPTTNGEALADKYARAAGRARANYAFYLGATNENLDDIKAITPDQCCGIKAFMGASTGNLLVDDPEALEKLFEHAPVLVATHCEDSPMIYANEAQAKQQFGDDVPMTEHPKIRSAEACKKSSVLATSLARKHDARLHVLHLTTAGEMELFDTGPAGEKRITAEVCVHHLHFDESSYPSLGTRIKCNPAIKSRGDREALRKAVAEDRIDIIATDHAPHLLSEKNNTYFGAPAGLPLVQDALLTVLEHYHEGLLTLEQIVKKTSHAVADVFGIADRGYLREGYWADLVLVDPKASTRASDAAALAKCGWTPFDGVEFRSRISATFVNGQVVWQNGTLTGVVAGERLVCDSSR